VLNYQLTTLLHGDAFLYPARDGESNMPFSRPSLLICGVEFRISCCIWGWLDISVSALPETEPRSVWPPALKRT